MNIVFDLGAVLDRTAECLIAMDETVLLLQRLVALRAQRNLSGPADGQGPFPTPSRPRKRWSR
jgi:hypothetical protein